MLYVIRDWLPFALVLIAYDLSRGAADLDRPADAVALAGRCRPLVVLRHRADGVAAGAPQTARPAVVGGRDQHRLHVVLHPAVRGRGGAVAAQPRRVEGVRQIVRRPVVRGAGDLRAAARRAAVGRRPVHRRRRRRRAVGPRCMFRPARGVPDGGLLGAMQTTQDGANGWVERIVGRGWGKLNLHSATCAARPGAGQRQPGGGDPVSARGSDAAIAAFLWHRVHRRGGRCWWPMCSSWRSRWCTPRSTTSSTSCWAGRWRRSCWWPALESRSDAVARRQRARQDGVGCITALVRL